MADTPHPVRFGVQTPQQQTSWQDMLSLWQEVDDLGFDTAWVFDHFLPIFSDPTGPCLEGWTALAALAMATNNVRLGVMVTGNTYRHPAVLAKMATTVDIISGGRLILGMGVGWFELEHKQYSIPFPQVRERLARLDEALEVIKRLWTEERASFTGRYYQLNEAVCNPRPVQQPPLAIDGSLPQNTYYPSHLERCSPRGRGNSVPGADHCGRIAILVNNAAILHPASEQS